jgi:pimeloyl-ACP methyl ester carboxylesterase
MNLFFRKYGQGKPLIILHGLFGSSDNWRTLGKKFAENLTAYLLDLRNHGRSPHSDDFSPDIMVDDLAEFLKQQQIEKASLLGHSLGGGVSMRFTAEYPEKVEKLVVVDFAPKKYQPELGGVIEWLLDWDPSIIKTLREANLKFAEILPEASIRGFLLKNLQRKKEGGFTWKVNLKAIYYNLDKVSGYLNEKIVVYNPTLFIRGGKSDYIKPEDIFLIRKHFNNAEIETIPEAGHWLHVDAPEKLVKLVKDFI